MKAECFILLCGCLILGLAGCSCKKSDRQQEILPVGAVDNTVGLNDTLGISLHPEYPVYSTPTETDYLCIVQPKWYEYQLRFGLSLYV